MNKMLGIKWSKRTASRLLSESPTLVLTRLVMTSLPRSDGLGRFPSDMAVLDYFTLPTYIKISHSLTYVIIFSRKIRNSLKSYSPTLQSIIQNKITTRNHQSYISNKQSIMHTAMYLSPSFPSQPAASSSKTV